MTDFLYRQEVVRRLLATNSGGATPGSRRCAMPRALGRVFLCPWVAVYPGCPGYPWVPGMPPGPPGYTGTQAPSAQPVPLSTALTCTETISALALRPTGAASPANTSGAPPTRNAHPPTKNLLGALCLGPKCGECG